MSWSPPGDTGQTLIPGLHGYTDLQLIAHGSTAMVFRATQIRLNRTVAIKVLLVDDVMTTAANVARELETTVALSSQPHIVSIIDTGVTDDGSPYIVMEYCEGGSYAQILKRRGPLPLAEVLEVGVKIGEALHAAHEVGIIHRDVKPPNILRSRFGPALTDFGIARAADDGGVATSTLDKLTPQHASPEAMLRDPQSGLSDLYSLASTMWNLLVGRAPFADPTRPLDPLAFRERVLIEPAPRVPREDVPEWLQHELIRAMAKTPQERHDSAGAFAETLRLHGSRSALSSAWPTPAPVLDPAAPELSRPADGSGIPVSGASVSGIPSSGAPVPGAPPGSGVPPVHGSPAGAPSAGASSAGAPAVNPPAASPPPLMWPSSQPVPADRPAVEGPDPNAPATEMLAHEQRAQAPHDLPTDLVSPPVATPPPPAAAAAPAEAESDAGAPLWPAPYTSPEAAPRYAATPPTEQPTSAPPADPGSAPAQPAPEPPAHPTSAPPQPSSAPPAAAQPASAPPYTAHPAAAVPAPVPPVAGNPASAPPYPASAPPYPASVPPAAGYPTSALPYPASVPPAAGYPTSAPPYGQYAAGGGAPHGTSQPTGWPQPTAPAGPTRRSYVKPLVAAGAVGITLGLTATIGVLAARNQDSASDPTRSASPSTPDPTGGIALTKEGAPRDLRIDDQGISVTLSWTDTTGGKVPFIIFGARQGQQTKALGKEERGQTSHVIDGLTPRADYCFVVAAAVSVEKLANSDSVCTSRLGANPSDPGATPS